MSLRELRRKVRMGVALMRTLAKHVAKPLSTDRAASCALRVVKECLQPTSMTSYKEKEQLSA